MVDEKGGKGTTLRLKEGEYYRDAGAWEVGYKWDGEELLSVSDMDTLDNNKLIEVSEEEWRETNKGYI